MKTRQQPQQRHWYTAKVEYSMERVGVKVNRALAVAAGGRRRERRPPSFGTAAAGVGATPPGRQDLLHPKLVWHISCSTLRTIPSAGADEELSFVQGYS